MPFFSFKMTLSRAKKGHCIAVASLLCRHPPIATAISPQSPRVISAVTLLLAAHRLYESSCNTRQSNSTPTPLRYLFLSSQRPLSNKGRGTPLPHLYYDSPPLPFISPFLTLFQYALDFTPHCHVDVFLQRLAFVPSRYHISGMG